MNISSTKDSAIEDANNSSSKSIPLSDDLFSGIPTRARINQYESMITYSAELEYLKKEEEIPFKESGWKWCVLVLACSMQIGV